MSRKLWPWFVLGSLGCARGPNVASDTLPLRRVVVYRNGVGYFERGGEVDETEVKFRMRQRMVGDFLATLAIVERGGSSLRTASFPLDVRDSDPTAPDPQFMRMLDAWQHPEKPPEPHSSGRDRLRDVILHLDGKQHDLVIGYVSSTPVWRPSYRIVIQDGGADLQAWGIVQNLSGEDWTNVELALVAGAPLAFESTLGDPVTPPRPLVTDSGEVIAAVPEGTTSLHEQEGGSVDRVGPPPEPSPAAPAPPPMVQAGVGGAASGRAAPRATRPASAPAKKADMKSYEFADAPAEEQATQADMQRSAMNELTKGGLSAPRRVSALAAVSVESGTTRYEVPSRLTVPDESATMVLLVSKRVRGEAVYLFGPDAGVPDSASHPFRVARFSNDTTGLLERGPIAVFEKGAFLGQGLLDPLPPAATATVPFALERSLSVESERNYLELGARLFKIEASAIQIERDSVTRTVYKIKNGSATDAKLLVRHPRLPASRLYKPPAGTEDNLGAGNALLPIAVKASGRAELTVEERRPLPQNVDWVSPLADEAVRAYLADARADATTKSRLSAAWSVRETLKKALDEQSALLAEQGELEKAARETRLSLEAIEKNKQAADLRAKLTARLNEVTSRLEQITKKLIVTKMTVGEQEVRFRDAIREIKLTSPLPPTD